jgi:hypothetical protein
MLAEGVMVKFSSDIPVAHVQMRSSGIEWGKCSLEREPHESQIEPENTLIVKISDKSFADRTLTSHSPFRLTS